MLVGCISSFIATIALVSVLYFVTDYRAYEHQDTHEEKEPGSREVSGSLTIGLSEKTALYRTVQEYTGP